jgi:hypothetical protein
MATVKISEVGVTSVRFIIGYYYISLENKIFIKVLDNKIERRKYDNCAKYFGSTPLTAERFIVT